MMLQLGDFGYNLDDDSGRVGDQFMRNIEQIAAYVPFMVNHGNHEDSPAGVAHYIERFRSQPSNAVPKTFTSINGETTNSMYFSWDEALTPTLTLTDLTPTLTLTDLTLKGLTLNWIEGLVHYISLSTELWFGIKDNATDKASLLMWLEKDLQLANRHRDTVPWIIMQGHRSVYCSCDGDCGGDATQVRP